jgi:hypothetical protein
MIRYRIAAALALALPLLSSTPAHAQRVLPLDPPIVLPPVGPQLRDAERAAEQAPSLPKEEKRLDQAGPVGGDNPGLGYDVTNAIQQRAIEGALPPR